MRIIGGIKKKMNLYGPETKKIRPTTDRAKESLFNIINTNIIDAVFIDLFSGTGSISLEAKSRGAKEVYSVDLSSESQKIINKNIEKSNLEINFLQQDVENFLNNFLGNVNIIFMDPPFDVEFTKIEGLIDLIVKNNILSKHGILIIERETFKDDLSSLNKYHDFQVDYRRYGKVSFIIMKKEEEE